EPAYVGDVLVRRGDLTQAVEQLCSDARRVLHEAALEKVEGRQPGDAGERVASEGASVRARRPVHLFGPGDKRPQGQARGDSFGEADDVGVDAPVLDGQ